MIEVLSLLIKDAKEKGRIHGINISANMTLNHLLFVDDVVLFGIGTVEEWMDFDVILETFCSSSGMRISLEKSGRNPQESLRGRVVSTTKRVQGRQNRTGMVQGKIVCSIRRGHSVQHPHEI